MTNRKISITPRIYAVTLLAVLLVSCSPQPDITKNDVTPPLETKPESTSVPTDLPDKGIDTKDVLEELPKGIEIVFWHPWSGRMANLANELVTEFNQDNEWGINVITEAYSDDLVLAQQVADNLEGNGQLPDLIAAPDFLFTLIEEEGVEFQDLNQYMTSQQWGIARAELERFYPIFLKPGEREDRRINFPAYRTGHFLFYNQTWADELGFPQVPMTPELFSDVACAAARANQFGSNPDNIGTGGWVYSFDANAFYSWLKVFGGGTGKESGSDAGLANIQNIDGSNYLFEMFLPQNNCAWRGRQSVPFDYFANRQAIAYSGSMEDILVQEQVIDLSEVEDTWTIIPYPALSGKPVVIINGESYGILSKDDERTLAAWLFIKWMTQSINQVKVVETTFSLPLSAAALDQLVEFRINHPAWSDALTYLPFMQPTPSFSDWLILRDIFSDISWQLTQYTTAIDDIPLMWKNADDLMQEMQSN